MSHRVSSAVAASLSLCLPLVLGCGTTDANSEAPDLVASIALFPASAALEPGQSLRLSPTLRNARRLTVTGRELTWASSDPLVALVDRGTVTAIRSGTVVITASVDGTTGTASITVQRAVSTVEIRPVNPTIAVGATVQLLATPRSGGGASVEGPVVFWATSDPSVARVDAGKVRGLRVGTAEITAMAGERSARTSVTVVPNISGRWDLTAALSDSTGEIVCQAAGTLLLTQAGSGLGGTLAQDGSCALPGGLLPLSGSAALQDGSVFARRLDFLAGGPLRCAYTGEVSGTPPASAAGDLACSAAVDGSTLLLRGRWEIRR